MRKNIISLMVLPTVLLLLITCTKPVENSSSPTSAVGVWHYAFPVIPTFTTDVINVWLDIKDDDSYSLELIERTDKKLFSSSGSWEATDDSIFLTGTTCTILDTTADPDTLAPLDAATCEEPIRLIKPQMDTVWTIQTRSVTTMLAALPIPQSAVLVIPDVVPEIELFKESN